MKVKLKIFLFLFVLLFGIHFAKADSLIYSKTYGKFQNAVSISTGRGEFVFVCDAATSQVFKFSVGGVEMAKFGGTGFGANELSSPLSIDAGNGLDLFICDNQNNRIQRLDYKLNFIAGYDFNQYNTTADNSKKIYFPTGIAALSTGDIAVITGSSDFKGVIITQFSDINTYFGSNFGFDRIAKPKKIVRGSSLDVWILDQENTDVINFSGTGQFIKKLTHIDDDIISITFFDDKLYLLGTREILIYDLKLSKYIAFFHYSIDPLDKINDFACLNNTTILLLNNKRVYEYNLIK